MNEKLGASVFRNTLPRSFMGSLFLCVLSLSTSCEAESCARIEQRNTEEHVKCIWENCMRCGAEG